MKNLTTLLFAALLAGQAWAQEFTVGNLKYTVTDATKNEVSVGKISDENNPTGSIEIPATVQNGFICEIEGCSHNNTELRNAVNATCCESGYAGDTYCSDCGEKIADGTVIPATGNHIDADGKWETDGTQNWHTCYYGTQFDVDPHTGGTATCTEKAKCSVCGVEYGECSSHGETEIRNAKEATCCEDGYTGDTYCKDCNTKIASGSVIPATGHHVDADGKWQCHYYLYTGQTVLPG